MEKLVKITKKVINGKDITYFIECFDTKTGKEISYKYCISNSDEKEQLINKMQEIIESYKKVLNIKEKNLELEAAKWHNTEKYKKYMELIKKFGLGIMLLSTIGFVLSIMKFMCVIYYIYCIFFKSLEVLDYKKFNLYVLDPIFGLLASTGSAAISEMIVEKFELKNRNIRKIEGTIKKLNEKIDLSECFVENISQGREYTSFLGLKELKNSNQLKRNARDIEKLKSKSNDISQEIERVPQDIKESIVNTESLGPDSKAVSNIYNGRLNKKREEYEKEAERMHQLTNFDNYSQYEKNLPNISEQMPIVASSAEELKKYANEKTKIEIEILKEIREFIKETKEEKKVQEELKSLQHKKFRYLVRIK